MADLAASGSSSDQPAIITTRKAIRLAGQYRNMMDINDFSRSVAGRAHEAAAGFRPERAARASKCEAGDLA
jgi:hypothetical protein